MSRKINMLEGPLWNQILLFAIPIAATSILQQLFNSADVAVVGRFAGAHALAAVGANGAIINLFVNTFVGLSIGTNVTIANLIGQGKRHLVKDAVHTSIMIALLIGCAITAVCFPLTPIILKMMSTPDNINQLATLYLRIYLCGAPVIMLYNFEAAILRSRGETRLPLFALAFSGIINVILNLFTVIVLHMSVAGVALSTVIANIISSGILLIYLTHDQGITHINIKELGINTKIIKQIAKIGVPAAMQSALFSISNVIVQASVNHFGPAYIAASADALNFEYLAYFFIEAFGQACVTFVGQNFGAKQLKRCRKVVGICLLEAAIVSVTTSAIMLIFAPEFASIFSNDPKIIKIANIRMFYLLTFETLNMCIEIFSGAMRGYGVSIIPALITIFGVCGVRILWIYTGAKAIGTFSALMMCYPISWAITDLILIIAYALLNRHLSLAQA